MLSLKEALELAKETKAFTVQRREGMVLITYLYHDVRIFGRYPLAKELRGAVWEESDETLLSRPFHKFYNLGEPLAAQMRPDEDKVLIAPKVDGILIQAFLRQKEVVKSTRVSLSMSLAGELLSDLWTPEHDELVKELSPFLGGATLLFEMVHPRHKILQEGQIPGLYLLAVRRISDGSYLLPFSPEAKLAFPEDPRDLEAHLGKELRVQKVQWTPFREIFNREESLEEALQSVRRGYLKSLGWETLEGAVASSLSGDFLKLKTPLAFWVSGFMMKPVETLLNAISDDRIDDLLSYLHEARKDLYEMAEAMEAEIRLQFQEGFRFGESSRSLDRKSFWTALQQEFPRAHQVVAKEASLKAYEGRDQASIWDHIRSILRKPSTQRHFEAWVESRYPELYKTVRDTPLDL